MTCCMSRDATKVLKCSKVSQPAAITVIHRSLPKGTVERSSFCPKILCNHCKNSWTSSGHCKEPHGHLGRWGCLRCGNAAWEVLQDGAEVMVRTKSDVWDSSIMAYSTIFSNNRVGKFANVWTRLISASPYCCHSLCFSWGNPRYSW